MIDGASADFIFFLPPSSLLTRRWKKSGSYFCRVPCPPQTRGHYYSNRRLSTTEIDCDLCYASKQGIRAHLLKNSSDAAVEDECVGCHRAAAAQKCMCAGGFHEWKLKNLFSAHAMQLGRVQMMISSLVNSEPCAIWRKEKLKRK